MIDGAIWLTEQLKTIPKGVCTNGYFQCANHTLCVSQSQNCDGKADCPNGSDELACEDQHDDEYYDHLYRKNPAAEHDDVTGNNCSFAYNGSCNCRKEDLSCAHKNLDKVPSDLPVAYIYLLDFSGNNFKNLTPDSLKYLPRTVEKLMLRYCGIIEIQEQTFYNLQETSSLYLDNNHIKLFPKNLFPHRNKLRILSLMFNDISNIDKDAFVNLENLTELDLRANKISVIEMKVYQPLKRIQILYLQMNIISYVKWQSFPELPLVQLSLMENKINRMDAGCYSNLTQLKSLSAKEVYGDNALFHD